MESKSRNMVIDAVCGHSTRATITKIPGGYGFLHDEPSCQTCKDAIAETWKILEKLLPALEG